MNAPEAWVALSEVEETFPRLWAELERRSDGLFGSPVVREMSVVAVVGGARQAQRVTSVLDALTETFALRGIVLVEQLPGDRIEEPWDIAQDQLPRALVAIRCREPAEGSGPPRCREHVLVPARTEDAPRLYDLVAPLLAGDLPTVVWVPQEPSCKSRDFRRFAAVADQLVLDSAGFSDPVRGLRLVSELIRDTRGRPVVADLSWERLRPWRELLAALFDDPYRARLLDNVHSVTISYGSEVVSANLVSAQEGPPQPALARALLLCGWLSSRLGWVTAGRGWSVEGDAARLDMKRAVETLEQESRIVLNLMPHRCRPGLYGGLETVTLEAGLGPNSGGAAIAIRRSVETGLCSATMRHGEREIEVHTVDMPLEADEVLLARRLLQPVRDEEFEEALMAAATLGELPGREGLRV